ncbi:MAG: IS4 family transposase [Burkholderiales bacterium]|nr:IS4 family transposase [Burkholderiales bacterium]
MKESKVSVFSQILRLIPTNLIAKGDPKHCNSRKFNRLDQFSALALCQLGDLKSLREIEDGMFLMNRKLLHSNVKPIKHTTLSYINKNFPWQAMQELYFALFKHYSKMLGSRGLSKKFGKPVYSIDSTTISVGLKLIPWAKYRSTKGAIKLHTALNNDVLLPEVITLTNGKVADVKEVEAIVAQLPDFSIIVMDRGYNDYELFEKLSVKGIVFVTRLKDNAVTTPYMQEEVKRVDTPDLKYGEYLIRFTGTGVSEEISSRKYRCIQWYDPEHERWFEFLTNDMDIEAPDIAALYRERWKIELFFKKLKQNLKIKTFLGTSENAVMNQVWSAAIVTLLLEVLRVGSEYDWSFSRLATYVRMALFDYFDLIDCLNRPEKHLNVKQKKKPPGQQLLPGLFGSQLPLAV